MIPIDVQTIEKVKKQAHKSPRGRSVLNFHQSQDKVQRMINAITNKSYVRPHKHEKPDKVEVFLALEGSAAVVTYNDKGEVDQSFLIERQGPILGAEIPPRKWHSVLAITPICVLYEVIEGPYNAETHKKFAPFAPTEEEGGEEFIAQIRQVLGLST